MEILGWVAGLRSLGWEGLEAEVPWCPSAWPGGEHRLRSLPPGLLPSLPPCLPAVHVRGGRVVGVSWAGRALRRRLRDEAPLSRAGRASREGEEPEEPPPCLPGRGRKRRRPPSLPPPSSLPRRAGGRGSGRAAGARWRRPPRRCSSTARAAPRPSRAPPAAAPPPGAGHAADYGEVNGTVGDRDPFLTSPGASDLPGPVSVVSNGSQPGRELSLAFKPTAKGGMFVKAGLKTKTFTLKSGLDRKNERCNESGGREGQPWDKAEMHPVANGIPANGSEYITNGCAGKGADNDGSGSESGYTTPKKRKGRRNSAKGCENLSLGQEKIVPCSSVPAVKLEPESFRADGGGDPKAGPRLDGLKPAWKCEQPPGALGAGRGKPVGVADMLRKAADAKVGPAGKKFEERPKGKHVLVSSSKEDSWTLFKPPPVFPVDNSSAKIVPKISYASKVKENLNKAVPSLSSSSSSSSSCSSSTGEVPAQPSTRLPQVPMSAMKSVTSGSFSNGPLLAGADRGGCPAGVQALLVPAASTVLSASPKLACQDASPSAVAPEQPKSSLFIYPSSMHGLFSVAESPFLATQQNLGDIFQNQWGLSFINEPSAGPETSSARKPTDTKGADVTFQGSFPATSVPRQAETPPAGPEPPAFPKAYELAKRTSPQLLGGLLKLGAAGEESELLLEPHLPGGLPQAEPGGSGAFVFLAKDYRVESCSSSPTNTLLVSTKEQSAPSSLERKASWGEFDLRAAVLYHIQEMESICNLQKRDPKRIITYAEGLDNPST
ncbi:FMR1-interacting protein NUFIP2 [Vipera latastei]